MLVLANRDTSAFQVIMLISGYHPTCWVKHTLLEKKIFHMKKIKHSVYLQNKRQPTSPTPTSILTSSVSPGSI